MQYATLKGLECRRCNFTEVDISYAYAVHMTFFHTVLDEVSFIETDLTSARIKNSRLDSLFMDEVDLTDIVIEGSEFNAPNIKDSRLIRAQIRDSHFIRGAIRTSNMNRAIIVNADMREMDFDSTSTQRTLFKDTDLRRAANFDYAPEWMFTLKTRFDRATMPDGRIKTNI